MLKNKKLKMSNIFGEPIPILEIKRIIKKAAKGSNQAQADLVKKLNKEEKEILNDFNNYKLKSIGNLSIGNLEKEKIRYSKIINKTIWKLKQSGLTIKEIAKKFNLSQSQIHTRIKNYE